MTELDDVDAARAQEYALLARLLGAAPSQDLLESLAQLRGDPSPLGLAHAALADAYAAAGKTRLAIEHYEKSLAINPKNDAGRTALAKLRARGSR